MATFQLFLFIAAIQKNKHALVLHPSTKQISDWTLFYLHYPKYCKGHVKRHSQKHTQLNAWLPVNNYLMLILLNQHLIGEHQAVYSALKWNLMEEPGLKNGLKKRLNLIRRWQLHPVSIYTSQKWLATSVFLGYYVQSWTNEGEILSVLLTCSHLIQYSFRVNLIQCSFETWVVTPITTGTFHFATE